VVAATLGVLTTPGPLQLLALGASNVGLIALPLVEWRAGENTVSAHPCSPNEKRPADDFTRLRGVSRS
jgi:hypothetical protein